MVKRKLVKYNIPNQAEPNFEYSVYVFGICIIRKMFYNTPAISMAHKFGFKFLVKQGAKKHYEGV